MKKIIINADDFGMSKAFDEVILELLEKGLIKSTSVLVLRGIEEQIAHIGRLKDLAKQKDISIGLHFDRSEQDDNQESIRKNIEDQSNLFVEYFGSKPDHLDKHKNIYSDREAQAMIDFAMINNIYIRDYSSGYIHKNKDRVKTSDHVIFLAEKNIDDMKRIISGMQDNETMEIIAHPGKFDPSCQSSLNKDREKDYGKILALDPFLEENDAVLINQKDNDCLERSKDINSHIGKFEDILKRAWSKDSSYYHTFDENNPALGQCAVTALAVNDYFGGGIVWCEAAQMDGKKISHYFNKIEGSEVDLTRSQFPEGTIIPAGVERKREFATTRDFILSSEDTKMRYLILRNKVDSLIRNISE